ncbi:hypothetical protein C8F04DRAFT_1177270 [Mycena alexandri]|uniref:Uncharacterized protein n=1 Tax=Mycena alexandri TaxID=1745969 RepID=A0AAD6XB10_9AGAR|nr:hypothetical protein C8F04DRAFT_1177270 [Mycena alexandri]
MHKQTVFLRTVMVDPSPTDGYESDTGPRDIPTVANFEKKEPVKTVIGRPQLGHRVLNRKGRAMCRIVHAHGWEVPDLVRIFNVDRKAIKKAIDNKYLPPDDSSKDYDFVEEDIKQKFPRVKVASKTPASPSPPNRTKRSAINEATVDGDHENVKKVRLEPEPHKRYHPYAGSAPTPFPRLNAEPLVHNQLVPAPMTAPAHTPVVLAVKTPTRDAPPRVPSLTPFPRVNQTPGAPPESLLEFLQNVMGIDMSAHFELLREKGFNDMALLRTMAFQWEEKYLRDILRSLLTGTNLGGRPALSYVELFALEIAIRKLNPANGKILIS